MDPDERPLGEKKGLYNFEDMPDAFLQDSGTKAESGPLGERLQKKLWKIKTNALDELIELYQRAQSPDDEVFMEYAPLYETLLLESHPTSLERAIDGVTELIRRTNIANSFYSNWLKLLVEKGLSHSKPSVKQKALEAALTIADRTENLNDFSEVFLELLSAKIPKVQIGGVQILCEFLQNFGIRKFQVKPYFKKIEALSQHQNGMIRNMVIKFYVELQRWIGAAIAGIIDHLKPAQKTELQAKFQQNSGPVKPKRAKAFQNSKQRSPAGGSGKKKPDEEDKQQEKIEEFDPYEMAPQINPWKKFNADWIEQSLKLQNWAQKKNAIDQLINACDVLKLSPNGFRQILPGLTALASHTNANLSTVGVQALNKIAKGTRVHFKYDTKPLIPILFGKFKQKKPALLIAVKQTFNTFLMCLDKGLVDVHEEVLELLKDKNPTVKINSLKWAKDLVLQTFSKDLKKLVPSFIQPIKKLTSDSVAQVRDTVLMFIGVLQARVGKEELRSIYTELNPIKIKKVEEAANQVPKSKFDQHTVKNSPKAREEAKHKNPSPFMAKNKVQKLPSPKHLQLHKIGPNKPPKAEQHNDLGNRFANKPKAEVKLVGAPKKPQISLEEQIHAESASLPGKQHAKQILSQLLQSQVLQKLQSSLWKDKQASLIHITTMLQQDVNSLGQYSGPLFVFLKSKLKEFKESNFVLIKLWIHLVQILASQSNYLNKKITNLFFFMLVQKLGDMKCKQIVEEAILSLAAGLGPRFICSMIIKYASEAKNPNIIKESCNLITRIPKEFGSANGLPLKEIIEFGKFSIANTNPGARKSAIDLLVSFYRWCGERAKSIIATDIKESTLKLLEEQISKVQPYGPNEFAAQRELHGIALNQKEEQVATKKGRRGDQIQALLESSSPRVDISSQITKKILKDFKDLSWKIRKEAYQQVENVIQAARNRILINGLNQLIGTLSTRLKEQTNKAVHKIMIRVIGKLGGALGHQAIRIRGRFFPQLIEFLTNKAAEFRKVVVEAMDEFAQAMGPEHLFCHFAQRLKSDSPEMRTQILCWMAAQAAQDKSLLRNPKVDLKQFIVPVINCLTKKEGSVRMVAEKFISFMVPILGRAPFNLAMKDQKLAFAKTIQPIINKYAVAGSGPCSEVTDNSSKYGAMLSQQSFDKDKFMPARGPSPAHSKSRPASHSPEMKKIIPERTQVLQKPWQKKFNPKPKLTQAEEQKREHFQAPSNRGGMQEEQKKFEAPLKPPAFASKLKKGFGLRQPTTFLRVVDNKAVVPPQPDTPTNNNNNNQESSRPPLNDTSRSFINTSAISTPKNEENTPPNKFEVANNAKPAFKSFFQTQDQESLISKRGLSQMGKGGIFEKMNKVDERGGFISHFKEESKSSNKLREMEQQIDALAFGGNREKGDSLLYFCKLLSDQEGKLLLKERINEIIHNFSIILINLFEKDHPNFTEELSRSLLTIVGKLSSCHILMSELTEQRLLRFQEQLLRKMLSPALEQKGPDSSPQEIERDRIVKDLNYIIQRVLQNSNSTYVLCSLIRLMYKYCQDQRHPKMQSLIVKCLLKHTKVLHKVIEETQVDRVLLQIHKYLLTFPTHRSKLPGCMYMNNIELGNRVIKTIINELVKLKGPAIYQDLELVKEHPEPDEYIQRWIRIILAQHRENNSKEEEKFTSPARSYTASSPANSNYKTKYGGGNPFAQPTPISERSGGDQAKFVKKVEIFNSDPKPNRFSSVLLGSKQQSLATNSRLTSFSDMKESTRGGYAENRNRPSCTVDDIRKKLAFLKQMTKKR